MTEPVWAVVPAAGVGRRMGLELPKQYLPIRGRPILYWTLRALATHPRVSGLVVALSPDDEYFDRYDWDLPLTPIRVDGGAERSDSVRHALDWLVAQGYSSAWAMVHDAVRPCVSHGELDRLLDQAMLDEHGGLLAVPVRDTLKRAGDEARVAATVDRQGLWQALTPQLFPAQALLAALQSAEAANTPVTDEAQVMELAGFRPRLVEGESSNIKLTRPGDWPLLEALLTHHD